MSRTFVVTEEELFQAMADGCGAGIEAMADTIEIFLPDAPDIAKPGLLVMKKVLREFAPVIVAEAVASFKNKKQKAAEGKAAWPSVGDFDGDK